MSFSGNKLSSPPEFYVYLVPCVVHCTPGLYVHMRLSHVESERVLLLINSEQLGITFFFIITKVVPATTRTQCLT